MMNKIMYIIRTKIKHYHTSFILFTVINYCLAINFNIISQTVQLMCIYAQKVYPVYLTKIKIMFSRFYSILLPILMIFFFFGNMDMNVILYLTVTVVNVFINCFKENLKYTQNPNEDLS